MKSLIIRLLHSLTGRVVIHVTLFSIVSVLVIFTIFLHMEKIKLAAGAARYTMAEMESLSNHIDDELHRVEITMDNLTWVVASSLNDPDHLYTSAKTIVESNDLIRSCTVAFVPDFYPDRGRLFAPCAVRTVDGTVEEVKDDDDYEYDYEYMNWYLVPTLSKRPYWGEPYATTLESKNGEDKGMMVVTYSKPLYDQSGKLYAVILAEVSLQNIAKLVKDMHLFPHSFSVLLDRRGMHIEHPDSGMVLRESFFADAYENKNENIQKMYDDVTSGRSGYILNSWQGKDYYIMYKHFNTSDWTILSLCPADEVVAGVESYALWASVIAIIFLILVVVVCHMSVRFVLHPIENMTTALRNVARGKYDNTLVAYNRVDELGRLRNAFLFMQESLARRRVKLTQEIMESEQVKNDMEMAEAMHQSVLQLSSPLAASVTKACADGGAEADHADAVPVDLDARVVSGRLMAGDMFVYFMENGRLYFLLMGVSGRGTAAAALMSTVCRLFRAEASHKKSPDEMVTLLNRALAVGNDESMFCPAFVGVFDIAAMRLDYCSAGHLAPVVMNGSGSTSMLPVEVRLPLGARANTEYVAQSAILPKDTVLCLYSDGVTDAVNVDMDFYGVERLQQVLHDNSSKSASYLVDSVFADVRAFAGDAEQMDDMTVMVIRNSEMTRK